MSKKATINFKDLTRKRMCVDTYEVPAKNRNNIILSSVIISCKKKKEKIGKITLFNDSNQSVDIDSHINKKRGITEETFEILKEPLPDMVDTINNMTMDNIDGKRIIIIDIPYLFPVEENCGKAIGAFSRLIEKNILKMDAQLVYFI